MDGDDRRKLPFPRRPFPLVVISVVVPLCVGIGGERNIIVGVGAIREARLLVGGDDNGHPPGCAQLHLGHPGRLCFRRILRPSLALRLLNGEPEGFGVFLAESPCVGLHRREGAAEHCREELVL